ncbi:ABC transporter substrate-binding protein [Paenibacillus sp. NPDC056579]|uniref:ABC transporter substrate-binding protein n=1 Tax=Paenibacillus sp. NPDC056579 TaxID=3345871 RepID=UPI00368F036E
MKKRKYLTALMTVILAIALAGCSSGGPKDGAGNKQNENVQPAEKADVIEKPVTLKIYFPFTDDVYNRFVKEPIEKKFPNVTLERLVPEKSGPEGMDILLSAGNAPDLFYAVPGWYGKLQMSHVFEDLTPLIQKYHFDMGRLHPQVLETIKSYSKDGKIEVMPESMATLVLVYNKAIFDKFGVPYPKDGMTWEQIMTVARDVSKTDNGTAFRGLDFDRHFPINNSQMSLPFVDSKTNKAITASDGWQKFFSTLKAVYDIPGNKPDKTIGNGLLFYKDKTLAMYVSHINYLNNLMTIPDSELQWDMVTMPSFSDVPGTGTQVNTPYYGITPTSAYKDEAFKVIAYLLSDEMQTFYNKEGRLTVLDDKAIRDQYGANLKQLSDKNVKAVTTLQPAKPRPFTLYDDYVVIQLSNALQKMAIDNVDLNTALREAGELADKEIENHIQMMK